jgi:hypothetical protein
MTFTSGIKFNYSLFYNYENFVNKLHACKYFFERNPNAENAPVVGKENLQFALDFSHPFKDDAYMNSLGGKAVINHNSVKVYNNLSLKGYGDLFESLNVSCRYIVYKI